MTNRSEGTSPAVAQLTVLVTDASYKHSVGIMRALGRAGHRVCAVSHHRYAPGFYSRYTTHRAIVPNPLCEGAEFAMAIAEHARNWNADVLIPVGYASVSAVTHAGDWIGKSGIRSAAPSAEQFDACSDKWLITKAAQTAGVQTPETILVGGENDLRRFLATHKRCVIKYRFESAGKGVVYLEQGARWEERLQAMPVTLLDDGTPNLIAQAYIDGIGQGYMALARQGRIVREFAHRRLREIPPEGGASTSAVSIRDEPLMAAGRRLLESIHWHGPAMVEFRSNESGHYLMELNPKYWGSLELALACGADFPGDHCRLAMGDDLLSRMVPPYRVGLRFWWPWRGDLRRLAQRPGDAPRLIRDLFSPGARSNWSWSDPVPNCIEIAGELTYPFRREK